MAAAAPLPGRDLRRARDRLGQADRRHRSGKSGHDKLALLGRTGALKAAWSRGRQHEPGSAIASGAEPGCVRDRGDALALLWQYGVNEGRPFTSAEVVTRVCFV